MAFSSKHQRWIITFWIKWKSGEQKKHTFGVMSSFLTVLVLFWKAASFTVSVFPPFCFPDDFHLCLIVIQPLIVLTCDALSYKTSDLFVASCCFSSFLIKVFLSVSLSTCVSIFQFCFLSVLFLFLPFFSLIEDNFSYFYLKWLVFLSARSASLTPECLTCRLNYNHWDWKLNEVAAPPSINPRTTSLHISST